MDIVTLQGVDCYIDSSFNTWTVSEHTKETALQYSESLVDCANCSNCRDCTRCYHCFNTRDSESCDLCRDMSECRHCRYCVRCQRCKSCDRSSDCVDCFNCSLCVDCRDCDYMSFSNQCNDCRDCDHCQGLTRVKLKPELLTAGLSGIASLSDMHNPMSAYVDIKGWMRACLDAEGGVRAVSVTNPSKVSDSLDGIDFSQFRFRRRAALVDCFFEALKRQDAYERMNKDGT